LIASKSNPLNSLDRCDDHIGGRVFYRFATAAFLALWLGVSSITQAQQPAKSPFNEKVGSGDWPQLGGSPLRNNVTDATGIPTDWDIKSGRNIKWHVELGSEAWGNVVVANGNVYVGTNNGAGRMKRYPSTVDLGVLLCFRETNGEFLWQHSSEKLATGRVHDWPQQGICSAPVAEGDRLWFVTNRGEVLCMDAAGFHDDENDGPFTSEKPDTAHLDWDELHESDIVWKVDMMQELGVRQHNMATCAPTIWGDVLFISTSNGVEENHVRIPAPEAPSFMAMDKRTGRVLWTDHSPGENILHGQWSCPVVGVFDSVPQVLFPGGDGWLYSFRADRWSEGKPELLWKFDGNPKDSLYQLGGRATRNGIVAIPVINDGHVYLAMGEDPEHGEGDGHLWCIDPTRRGDVSPELVVNEDGEIVPHRRLQAFSQWEQIFATRPEERALKSLGEKHLTGGIRKAFEESGVSLSAAASVTPGSDGREWLIDANVNGEQTTFRISQKWNYSTRENDLCGWKVSREKLIPNPNSAMVWHYNGHDQNGDGKVEFEETMHRTVGSPAIKDNFLFITDFSGLVHCLNAETGTPYWTCDLLAACWTTPLIVGDTVYVGDEDGDVAIFALSPDPAESVRKSTGTASGAIHEPLREIHMETSIFTMPIVANHVLYIAARNELFAIAAEK
jgi:outer membrane protein assembly factor BamB